MSRGKKRIDRKIAPDPIYRSVSIAKFINYIMIDGKKRVAQKIFYGAMDKCKETFVKLDLSPVEAFDKIIESVKPAVEVKSKRIGGATYQVPIQVSDIRAIMLAMKWLVSAMNKRSERGSDATLGAEFIDILLNNKGEALKQKENIHKSADSNKAFSHLS